MPVIQRQVSTNAPVRVLVSGANGFIALHVVTALLDQGYTVRGTVRSAEKGRLLAERFQAVHGGRFEWVVVADIAKDGAFDEAVKDVDAIQHIASPAGAQGEDQSPDVYIKPAVEGTLGILRSALKFGHSVKRIVLTSSTTAIWRLNISETDPALPVILDENDWCEDSLADVRERGSEASVLAKYSASKALSEQAAWAFYREHQNEISWDLVALLPAMVIGVPLMDISSPDNLPDSLGSWFRFVFREQPEYILKVCFGYVDVADCVHAHVKALEAERVGGERIIICAGSSTFQDTRNLILSLPSESTTGTPLPTPLISAIRGNPALKPTMLYRYNADKARELLGLEYRGLDETCAELVRYFGERGWLSEQDK